MNQTRGYHYLRVIRTWKKEDIQKLFQKVDKTLQKEQVIIFERHNRKWTSLTNRRYPSDFSDYQVDYRPVFPFKYADEFLFNVVRAPSSSDTGLDECVFDAGFCASNETELVFSPTIQTCLAKGPNYRAPPNLLNKQFFVNVKKQLDRLKYNFRWNAKLGNDEANESLTIPFSKNTVSLPPKMNVEIENKLQFFSDKAFEIIHKESRKVKNEKRFKKETTMIRNTKRFLTDNAVEACASDKTSRFVITYSDSLLQRSEKILTDDTNYCKVQENCVSKIENQANAIIRNTCNHILTKSDFERLLASGSHAANFRVKIKDHKDKTDQNTFPLRPIASSVDTPTSKIDWLVTKILTQLIQFVHTNIKNSNSLIDELKNLKIEHNSPCTFVSLDVINLYPSIPIRHGIEVVSDFLKKHWNDINTYSLTYNDVVNCLKFVSYNYLIKFNDNTYKQIKGCPMGARFSPPFAVIYMYHVEQNALEILKNKHNIIPQYYGRYIDDIILGPFIKDDLNSINTINLVFNSVSQDIKFIVEVPSELILNFLDISISINNNLVEYQWFVKNSHSGISLNKHSWVPHHVKSNYIKNSQVCVANKCSNQNYKDEAFSKLTHRFEMNGFTKRDISIKLNGKNKKTNKNDVPFKINFVNDTCNRKLNKLIKQCNLPIKLISKPAPTLESVFKNKSDNKHKECHLCSLLPKHIACRLFSSLPAVV